MSPDSYRHISDSPRVYSPVPRRGKYQRQALTLLEVVVSTLIVGVMAVAALNALGAATRSGEAFGNRAVALGLADDLMAEILQSSYQDLDTFDNWDEQLTGDRADWSRAATVLKVVPSDPTQTTPGSTDQGAKRINVTVEYRGEIMAELVAIRTDIE